MGTPGRARKQHPHKALTAATVRNKREPGFYADGNGLYLKVDKSGAKRWIQRIVINGRRRDLGLGSATLVTLAEAREKALENRRMARAGGDPLADQRRASAVPTFAEAAKLVYKEHLPTWRNPKHGKQWIGTLESYAFPCFGNKSVAEVTTNDVLAALSPIWVTKPETAARVRQRIGSVMKWAKAKNYRLDNPAADIAAALPKRERVPQHRAALPYKAVACALTTVGRSGASMASKLALEFLVLTATRSGEVRGARWDEFDIKGRVWTIPANRMKAKKPHRVPLAPRCLEILDEAEKLRCGSEFVFPSAGGKPLSDSSLSKLLRELGVGCVPHGFRTSFRVWAAEQTDTPREVCEFALAHVIKDRAEAAYSRSDLFEKRRKLMDQWAEYLASGVMG